MIFIQSTTVITTIDDVKVYCSHNKIVKLTELKQNPKNPNTHPERQLELLGKIIKVQGWRNPITVSIKSGYIVRGHGRLLAAMYEGLTEAPVDYQYYETEEEEIADLVADNRIAELAEIDKSILNDILSDIDFENFDASLTGYSLTEIQELKDAFSDIDDLLNEKDADEIPEPQEKHFSKLGDKWILGNHILVCGDSTKEEYYKLLLDDDCVDMIITDPPYNVDYEGAAGKIKNDSMASDDFKCFLDKVFINIHNYTKPGGAIYVWHADTESVNFRTAFSESGFLHKETLIWVKNTFVMGRQDYHWKHEPCLYGWKDGAAHYFIDDRTQSTIFEYAKPAKSELHPTMKPVDLFQKQIENSSRVNEIVLDTFGGSGTTLIACEKAKRKARLIEFDPKFVDVIVKRYLDFTGKKDIKCIRDDKEIDIKDFLQGEPNEN